MGSETLREKRKQPELMGISFSFNAKEELYRCLDDLRFRFPKPREKIIKRGLEDEGIKLAQPELEFALREIDKARKKYLLMLENAQVRGEIDREDYFRIERDATHSFERFERDIRERYSEL